MSKTTAQTELEAETKLELLQILEKVRSAELDSAMEESSAWTDQQAHLEALEAPLVKLLDRAIQIVRDA